MTARAPRRRAPATRGEIIANWLALLALLALGVVWPGEQAGRVGTRSARALRPPAAARRDAPPVHRGTGATERGALCPELSDASPPARLAPPPEGAPRGRYARWLSSRGTCADGAVIDGRFERGRPPRPAALAYGCDEYKVARLDK